MLKYDVFFGVIWWGIPCIFQQDGTGKERKTINRIDNKDVLNTGQINTRQDIIAI